MEKKINLYITNNDIQNALGQIISLDLKNRKDIIRFLGDYIASSDKASEYFIKMALGGKYPTLPKKGDVGFIKLSEHNYTFTKSTMGAFENSPLNQHGYIPCTVSHVNGIHNYAPLTIDVPSPIDEGAIISCSMSLENFYPGESIDIYEDLPI